MLYGPEAVIFDMDGTLFQTETLLISAYHTTFDQLRQEGVYKGETPNEEIMLKSLGMILDQLWQRVLPDWPESVRKRANELFIHYGTENLKAGLGQLYPGVKDTLQFLHDQGVRLFVASNGIEDYVRQVAKYKELTPLFEGLYSAEEFNTQSKTDLVKLLLDNYGISNAWMVGDRSSDVKAGLDNSLGVVGCNYAGFGDSQELAGAHAIITSFSELKQLYVNAASQ